MKSASLIGTFVFACLTALILGPPKPQALIGNQANVTAPAVSSAGSQNLDQTKASLPQIRVWREGSYPSAEPTVPPDLERRAKNLGYTLRIEVFDGDPPEMSKRLLEAFANNQEPDILATGNGITRGRLNAPPFTGADNGQEALEVTHSLESLRADASHRGGPHEYLFRSSRNYEVARALALQFPGCDKRMTGLELPGDLRTVFERIGRAYLEGPESVAEFNDPDRLQTEGLNPQTPAAGVSEGAELRPDKAEVRLHAWGLRRELLDVQVHEMTACGYWGNEHLAFVPIISTYESRYRLGWLAALLVLRNQEGKWRLLTATTDPFSRGYFLPYIPKLVSLLDKPWIPDFYPAPAKLLAPDDGKGPVSPSGAQLGSFVWQPSESGNVVAQIVEVVHNDDARLFIRFPSANAPTAEQLPVGMLPTTRTLCRWRVWSISDTGAVSFSQSRSFPN